MSQSAGVPRALSGRAKRVLVGIAAVVALVILFLVFTRIYTNVLWYRSIDFGATYRTLIGTRIALFAVAAVLLGGAVLLNLVIARRTRPQVVPNTPDQQLLARYRRGFDPFLRVAAIVISAIVALVGGLSADGQWRTVLGFLNRTSFGKSDPQFGMDAGFYVFTYPFVRLALGYGFAAVVVGFFAAAVAHYLFGGVRIGGGSRGQLSTGARAHLSVLAGLFMVLKAVDYWLDRYGLVNSEAGGSTGGVTDGASYTDVHAVLPAKTILAAIALLCALLFVVSALRRGLLFGGLGVGLLVLSAILIGGAYPAVVQQFQVKPNQEARERPYIDRNIKGTRHAFDLNGTDVKSYNARSNVSQDQTSAGDNTKDIRMVDPNVVSKTFQQLQQIRGFYNFSEALDVDRYDIDGKEQTSIAAVRELPAPPEGRRGNWVVDHLQYTHGYGFVAADGSRVDDEGKPIFQEKDIPPKGKLGKFQPRVYFGEKVPDYSIAGAAKGSSPQEFDYSSEGGSGQTKTTYDGGGGVNIGSFWKRLLYAVQMGDYNILFSSDINEKSQILYDRNPRERVQKAAPYLELDGDPYPAVIDGKVQWIVDGYTTTNNYPYSERVGLDEATKDSLTGTSSRSKLPSEETNYIRNSVKATVDAYTGEVKLYAWDSKDPILKTWQKTFGNKVRPLSQMSDGVRDHVRYPADLFKAQREMLSRYHVTNPSSFYGGQEYWQTPNDPTSGDVKAKQPPYYLKARMPGDKKSRFSLTSTFVPKGRPNLAGFVSVSSDPDKGYGKLRLLKLPSNTAVPGPGTMQGQFKGYRPAAKEINLLSSGGSSVRFGNLLTLPFGGGLLYVEPIYVQAKSGESYPLLQRVLVSFGGKIGYGATLDEAMDQVLGGGSKGDDDKGDEGDKGDKGGDVNAQLAAALQDIQKAYKDGQAALKKGDFSAYGDAQKRLKAAADKAERLRRRLGASSSPSPSASGNGRPPGKPSGSASVSPSTSRSP